MQQTKENLIYGYPQNIHEIAENIIKHDVYLNVSYLVSELARNDQYMDELLQVMCKDDYNAALFEWWNNADKKEQNSLLEYANIDGGEYENINDLIADADCQDLCDYIHEDPFAIEALEHYIVSDWLADKLEEQGEMVLCDFLGLNIWGRTTSGQAIILDGIMQRIAEGL